MKWYGKNSKEIPENVPLLCQIMDPWHKVAITRICIRTKDMVETSIEKRYPIKAVLCWELLETIEDELDKNMYKDMFGKDIFNEEGKEINK